MSHRPTVIFFGSFLEYSAMVLEALLAAEQPAWDLIAVVSTPPKPAGRAQTLQKTHVHKLAEARQIPVFTPDNLKNPTALKQLPKCDYFLTAGYGKLLPPAWLEAPTQAALNIHFSLLPKYRGANPAEWALLARERESGVTVIEMAPSFDTGAVVAQSSLPVSKDETRETLYQKLYSLAGSIAGDVVTADFEWRTKQLNPTDTDTLTFSYPPVEQGESPTPYARRLTKEDSWISEQALQTALGLHTHQILASDLSPFLWQQWQSWSDFGAFIETAFRALFGFPGLWTIVSTAKGEKRLKIHSAALTTNPKANQDQSIIELNQVQLEGQQIATWNQVKNAITWVK